MDGHGSYMAIRGHIGHTDRCIDVRKWRKAVLCLRLSCSRWFHPDHLSTPLSGHLAMGREQLQRSCLWIRRQVTPSPPWPSMAQYGQHGQYGPVVQRQTHVGTLDTPGASLFHRSIEVRLRYAAVSCWLVTSCDILCLLGFDPKVESLAQLHRIALLRKCEKHSKHDMK
jgi:hypothetical protein